MTENEKNETPGENKALAGGNAGEAPVSSAPESTPEDETMKCRRGIYDFVEMLTGSVAAVILIFTLLFRLASVEGTSMTNTLQNGDKLIVSAVVGELEHGDIVAIQKAEGYSLPLVKRVIATGGETVIFDFTDWKVSIKDKDGNIRELDEYYVNRVSGAMHREDVPMSDEVYVPEGYLFVMGDNRNGSADSRNSMIGLISVHEVMGKAIFRIFPLSDIGSLALKK